jgi:hypothetical protein
MRSQPFYFAVLTIASDFVGRFFYFGKRVAKELDDTYIQIIQAHRPPPVPPKAASGRQASFK